MESLSFLIPAYNDETTIGKQINEARGIGEAFNIPYEIVVINDASQDKTAQALSELAKNIKQLRTITHKSNRGYGSTIKELYYEAKKEWLFTIPGDYQVQAKEIKKLLPHQKKADIIIGWRTSRHDTGARQRQSRIYNLLIPFLFDTNTHDVNSVRLMKTRIMKTISLKGSSAFVDAELVIKAKHANFSILEIPIGHRHRQDGTGGGGKLNVILPTIWEMFLLKFGLL